MHTHQTSRWVTFKEAGEILGVSPHNMRQIRGFDQQVRTKPGAPYKGKFYNRADLKKLAKNRSSGQLPAGKRVQLTPNGSTTSPLTIRLNRKKIAEQEEAVRSGKLKPRILPMRQTDY